MARSGRGRKSDEDRPFDALPADGASRTNRQVRDELNLPEARYWAIRDRLVERRKDYKEPRSRWFNSFECSG
jgi:hypothetical protein